MQEFNSVDEILFFMESMFTEGFDEESISKALDVFLRDVAQFQDEHLESATVKLFIRQLGANLVTFKDEANYVKTAQFMDWFCIDDTNLWVNLEQYVLKKERIFSGGSLLRLL